MARRKKPRMASRIFKKRTEATQPVVELSGVFKTYTEQTEPIHALNNVSLKVARGEMVAIMGPSGSGKTTLLNMIGLLDAPDKGTLRFRGEDSTTLKRRQLPQFRQERVGFIFQQKNLIPTLTALENVYLPFRYRRGKKQLKLEQTREALRLVNMVDRASHRPSQLSGGQQQRVAIARALVLSPAVVLADEPTGELDSKAGHAVIELMHDLSRQTGQTFIIVTHNEMVAASCDRLFQMQDGRLREADVRQLATTGGRAPWPARPVRPVVARKPTSPPARRAVPRTKNLGAKAAPNRQTAKTGTVSSARTKAAPSRAAAKRRKR